MMKSPCSDTERTGPSYVQGLIYEGRLFSNCIFRVPSLALGLYYSVFKENRNVKLEGGSWIAQAAMGGFALCWVKPDLLKLF